ncbi:PQQ-binding-like beta-propeller repeat protein [Glycomyces harbinensis]|uniref:Outer membrane protein assembly factor BamB, contains PQQ-like beta-propeller repeat n=1 Tax=Glycomyces harbinensis TaxID=58114 RepID=A0A1G6YMH5_9ACTN|nr:PQQ-binding-like beta-propeller repeat protein [Glycomyces harbinensis]SDD90736.1 Outer membrane protein assembly factor BamB, contains PQQ-like beta-propeller repeat [Glycomyces harbinensis]
MSHSASGTGRRHTDAAPAHSRRAKTPTGRPLARVFLRTAGLTSLVCWAVLLVWASFGTGASSGSSGLYMIIGTVASVLTVAVVIATAASYPGLRTIIGALIAAVFAAAAGWAVYSSMPEAGPGQFITHRAGVAALAYGFGVVGGGLLALSEFVVEGYAGGRAPAPKPLRRKVAVLAAAIVVMLAAALAPAMSRWAELANQDVLVADAAASETALDGMAALAGVERFTDTPYGLLRTDHPTERTPQAVTMLDPATGAAVWYHRRWNWLASQQPVLSHAQDLVALTGPRADNADDYQTRVLRSRDGSEVATAGFDGDPGVLLALAEDRLLYAEDDSEAFHVYDFDGELLWDAEMPAGCEGTAAQIADSRVLLLADCVPAPDRPVARDYVLAFDLDDGDAAWQRELDIRAVVLPESFLVTEDSVIVDSRIEHRVTDGPFSARRFEHKLISYSAADGSKRWHMRDQSFGSTNSSACGGTLHLSQPTAKPAAGVSAAGDAKAQVSEAQRRTVQIIECYSAKDREGSWLGVMSYDADSGERLHRESVRLGYAPLDPEVARGWGTVLPDNRALLATDLSLDPTRPDCRLYQVDGGKPERVEFATEHADGTRIPEDWCHDAQLSAVGTGAAVSYVDDDGTRGIAVVS